MPIGGRGTRSGSCRTPPPSRTAPVPGWARGLGLFKAVVVTLTYLRRNRVQAELAETFGVSQPTISRAISGLTPVLGRVLADYVPVAEDLDPRTGYIVDGTLLPCWSWHGQQQLYSGKHHTTGLNVQVACDLTGRLAWISDPVDGCRHDTAALRDSGVLNTLDASKWMGDKGFVGNGMVTPIKKPAHRLTAALFVNSRRGSGPLSMCFFFRLSGPGDRARIRLSFVAVAGVLTKYASLSSLGGLGAVDPAVHGGRSES